MNNIKPLLGLPFSEVLITFMTDFIIRFSDYEQQEIKNTFKDLFGSDKVQEQWKDLKGREREAAIIDAYRRLKKFLAAKKHVKYDSILMFLERPTIYESDIKE